MADSTELRGIPERRRAWNEHVSAAVSAVSATLFVGFLAAILVIVVRWVAHVTGVWPL